MDFLHDEFDLNPGDIVEVNLDGQANVMLLDSTNYDNYKNGRAYRYYGGHAEVSPVRLPAPRGGKWHLVVNLGGYPGSVRAGVRVLRGVGSTR